MTKSSLPDDLNIAHIPERYKVIAVLGTGGMGTVYKAFDSRLNKHVAIKVLTFGPGFTNEQILRFQKEAKAAACLAHENIVKIIDFGSSKKQVPYMVLEYIDGPILRSLIKQRGFLPLEEALPIFRGILEALAHAHSRGIIHRDLKTSNVLLSRDNVVKLFDFGTAQISDPAKIMELTMTNLVLGTPSCMSPEQALAEPADARSDIYSFGCMMFETVTGRLPFEHENAVELMNMHIEATPPLISHVCNQNLPQSFENIVDKCLQKDPDRRFQSAQELLEALSSVPLAPQPNRAEAKQRAAESKQRQTVLATPDTGHQFRGTGKPHTARANAINVAFLLALIVSVVLFSLQRILDYDGGSGDSETSKHKLEEKKRAEWKKLAEDITVRQFGGYCLNFPADEEYYQPQVVAMARKGKEQITSAMIGMGPLSDDFMNQLAKMQSLKRLIFDHSKLSKQGFKQIASLANLHELSLYQMDITPERFDVISQMDQLTMLVIKDSDSPIEDWHKLSSLTNLRTLIFDQCKLSAGFGKELAKLNELRSLGLRFCFLDDQTCAAELPNLQVRSLDLEGSQITPKALESIKRMKNLNRLELVGCQSLKEADIAKFKKQRPDLDVIDSFRLQAYTERRNRYFKQEMNETAVMKEPLIETLGPDARKNK